jgi:hypothetical protein
MQQADEPASRAPVGELLDSLHPVSPGVNKKVSDGRILGLLQGPDFDMAHAFATADQQPLWIRHKPAVEEPEIHMGLKHGDVENGIARIGRIVPYGIARDVFVDLWGNRFDQSTERLDDRFLLGGKLLQPGSNWFSGGTYIHRQILPQQVRPLLPP